MRSLRKFHRWICSLLAIAMFGMSIQSVAVAGIVTTTDLVNSQHLQMERERIHDWMARADVREQLTSLGVDVEQAQQRVAGMTDEEVQQMAARMDQMPVGSGAGEVVIIALLVLIILELSGVTDIFTKI